MKTRDIKFRAWDHREGKMWEPIIRPDGVLMTDNLYGGYTTYYDQIPSDPLMQYTGLKDKNGVEIYEGDVVVAAWHWTEPHLVELPDDYYDFQEYALGSEELEVLGNIYENPELLESP